VSAAVSPPSAASPAALEALLRSIPLFSGVEPGHVAHLARLLKPVELTSGEVLFREGELGGSMWVLAEGVEVVVQARVDAAGPPVTVATLGAGEVVGEMALVDEGLRSATATVTQPGRAYKVDALEWQALRDAGHPAAYQVLRRICQALCQRLRATTDRIAPAAARGDAQTHRLFPVRRPEPAELDAHPLFRDFPEVVKLALAQKLHWVETDEVEPLFAEGDPGDCAFFLVEGEVAVRREGRVLERVRAGQLFGLIAVLDAGPRSASCATSGPARLLRLGAPDFDALFARGNRFAYHVVDVVARQLVGHLRQANRLLPAPSLPSASAGQAAGQGAGQEAAGAALATLDLELELGLDPEQDFSDLVV
jgi:CRP-like cAMP-binding protein